MHSVRKIIQIHGTCPDQDQGSALSATKYTRAFTVRHFHKFQSQKTYCSKNLSSLSLGWYLSLSIDFSN